MAYIRSYLKKYHVLFPPLLVLSGEIGQKNEKNTFTAVLKIRIKFLLDIHRVLEIFSLTRHFISVGYYVSGKKRKITKRSFPSY
jgi:hypothetical protein